MKTFAVALLLIAGAAHAQIAYKGLPLAAEKQALLERFPSLQCAKPPPQFTRLGEEVCTERPCSGAACQESEKALGTYANMPAWDASFAVVGGRVEGFAATINKSSYEAVRDALRQVYGVGRESTQPMQTLGGARVDSRVWEAATANGTVTVMERVGRLDEGRVDARTPAFDSWLRRGPDARKNSKDL